MDKGGTEWQSELGNEAYGTYAHAHILDAQAAHGRLHHTLHLQRSQSSWRAVEAAAVGVEMGAGCICLSRRRTRA